MIGRRIVGPNHCALSLLSGKGYQFRQFSQTLRKLSEINPSYPDESYLVRIRKPGRQWSDPIDPSKKLALSPIYDSPAGGNIGFTKRAGFGVGAVSSYVAYLLVTSPAVPSLAALSLIPFMVALPIFQYLSKPYVTRIFRLYDREGPQSLESIVKDETLVVEQVGAFGRSVFGTAIKLKDIRLAKPGETRFGWANWIYTDQESGEVIPLYVADNVGGIKMDRIWGIIERNSGVDYGRSFLSENEVVNSN